MTPKERIRAALAHKEVDKVPTTMQCVETAWDNLKKYLNVETEEEVLQHFDIDTRIMDLPPYIGPAVEPFVNENGDTVYTHPFGYQYINKWNGVEYNSCIITTPYDVMKTFEDFERFEGWFNPDYFDYNAVTEFVKKHEDKAIRIGWPGPYQVFMKTFEDFERFEGWFNPDYFDYNAVTEFVKKHEDKAIRIGWPGPYQVFTLMYNTEEFYVNMYEEPELIKAMLDRYCQASYEIYERMYEAANNKVDIIRCCDDYGTQISTLFSPSMWDEFFAKNTKMFVEQAHRHGAYYMQHSCGAVRNIIPNLVNCNIDALEPLQKVIGMEADGLKKDFGEKICFQGGVDTQHVLPNGTPQEVFDETTRIIRTLHQDGKAGGYILCSSQDFEGDVPPKNICALYEAGKQYKA